MDERRVAAAGDIALLISRGELPAAARALRNELLGRPDRPDMMNLLARLLETALRTARSPFAPDPPPADIGEDLYLRGFAALGDGQLDAADGAFRAGFAVGPADYACRIALAVIVILATQADGIRLALAEAGAVDVHRIDGLLRIEPVDRPIRGRALFAYYSEVILLPAAQLAQVVRPFDAQRPEAAAHHRRAEAE